MLLSGALFVGIDPTAAHKAFTYAALDRELSVVALAEGELEDVLTFLGTRDNVVVAINSPSQLNAGLVRKTMEGDGSTNRNIRGADLRVAEQELRRRGIAVNGTASRDALCSPWVRIGFSLFRALAERGYEPYPAEDCRLQWLETHPHAAYCALLGRSPLSRVTVEGRLQRQLALHERGLRIPDPMEYFEEITRHKLLNGILPQELVYPPEQLDALVAALTAWVASERRAELSRLGHDLEGYISLPVPALKEKY